MPASTNKVKYGGIEVSEANTRLKRLLADAMLNKCRLERSAGKKC